MPFPASSVGLGRPTSLFHGTSGLPAPFKLGTLVGTSWHCMPVARGLGWSLMHHGAGPGGLGRRRRPSSCGPPRARTRRRVARIRPTRVSDSDSQLGSPTRIADSGCRLGLRPTVTRRGLHLAEEHGGVVPAEAEVLADGRPVCACARVCARASGCECVRACLCLCVHARARVRVGAACVRARVCPRVRARARVYEFKSLRPCVCPRDEVIAKRAGSFPPHFPTPPLPLSLPA
jgi:hypothetical protein